MKQGEGGQEVVVRQHRAEEGKTLVMAGSRRSNKASAILEKRSRGTWQRGLTGCGGEEQGGMNLGMGRTVGRAFTSEMRVGEQSREGRTLKWKGTEQGGLIL